MTTAFKLKGVVHAGTNDHPVVFGPIGMTYHSKKEDYDEFFHHIATQLELMANDTEISLVLGKITIPHIETISM